MDWINNIILSQADSGATLYGLTGTIGIVAALLLVAFYCIRMKTKLLEALKGVVIAVLAYCFSIYAHRFLIWYQEGFELVRYFDSTANLAVAFTLLPLLAWLCAKTFNTTVGFAGDVTALTLLGFHTFGRSGCIFTGCCYGFPCEWGLFSKQTGANQFPVCIVESLFTLAILIFIIVRICRKGYTPDGKNLPWFLLLYGICRFFSEMTRESTSEYWLFWRISDIHIHMLVMATVGGFLLWHVVKKERAAAVGEKTALPTLSGNRK